MIFAALYASEGAPIGFIWWALPALLRSVGVPIEQITALTAVLLLPWMFKFLWAPVLDAWRGPRWGYRAWLVTMQIVMALTLLPLAWLDPITHFDVWRWLLLAHGFAAATQDVAIDALAIGVVPPDERGRLNGAMQAGLLTGRSVFGGGALLVAAEAGRAWLVVALVAWILAALGASMLVREVEAPRERGGSLLGALAKMGRRRATWIGLVFALVAAAGFEATGQLAGPFLIDRGISSSLVGVFFSVFAVGAMLVGGLTGGVVSDRRSRAASAAVSMAGFVAMIILLAVIDLAGGSGVLLIAVLTGLYFFVGVFTATSYAIFMDLTDARIGATQFSAFMAATNGCESWSAWAGGRLAASHGYPAAFLALSAVSLAALPLLRLIDRRG